MVQNNNYNDEIKKKNYPENEMFPFRCISNNNHTFTYSE